MKPPKAGDPYKTLHPGSVGVPKDINDRTSTDSSTGVIKGEKNSGAHETKIDANANSNAAKSSIITQGTQVTSMKTSTLSAEAVKPTVTTNGNSQPIQTTSNANAGTDKTTAPQAATGKTAPRVTLRRPHYDQNGKSSNQSPSGPQSGQNSKSPSING